MLRKLFSKNLKLNSKKCEFYKKQIKYLRYLIDREEI